MLTDADRLDTKLIRRGGKGRGENEHTGKGSGGGSGSFAREDQEGILRQYFKGGGEGGVGSRGEEYCGGDYRQV